MSLFEFCVIFAAVAGALLYLGRLAWRRWSGRGGCCGNCPVAAPKMRLAAPGSRAFIKPR